jgi:hypothetical protein
MLTACRMTSSWKAKKAIGFTRLRPAFAGLRRGKPDYGPQASAFIPHSRDYGDAGVAIDRFEASGVSVAAPPIGAQPTTRRSD